jgi:hypothetical protein
MKQKIEQAITKCLEDNGFLVRSVSLNDSQDLQKAQINYICQIKIRAEKAKNSK